ARHTSMKFIGCSNGVTAPTGLCSGTTCQPVTIDGVTRNQQCEATNNFCCPVTTTNSKLYLQYLQPFEHWRFHFFAACPNSATQSGTCSSTTTCATTGYLCVSNSICCQQTQLCKNTDLSRNQAAYLLLYIYSLLQQQH